MGRSLQQVIAAERDARIQVEEQSRRAQEASRLKSQFLANMSHELRTPLNSIIGFAELMHDGRVGPISADHREYLADILTSARHLLQIINDVLDLTKVESGTMQFRPEPLDLRRLAEDVRDTFRETAARKWLRLEVVGEPGLGTVHLDPGKVRQVLNNYVSNAVKFTPEDGQVTIRVAGEGPDFVRIEVEDTGIGIAAEDLGRLFVEFQQLDASFAKRQQGTGLGLALTRRIVEAQGGRVDVRSVLGQGSTFVAILPRAAAPSAPSRPALRAGRARAGVATVLVVDADATDRAWLQRVLLGAGYEVEAVGTGTAALQCLRHRRFDAVALSLALPDMTPAALMAQLRADERGRDMPVIAVTVAAERGAAAGFTVHDFLAKPVQAEELLATLTRAGVTPAGARPILLVDDDVATLRFAHAALSGRGYRVLTAASAAEGLRVAAADLPAAVVLDLTMPGMDGFEFLERYRERGNGGATPPVIVWTARDLTATDRARLGQGVEHVVSKREGGARRLLDALDTVLRAG
jgi:CheY-like chemotaxis protein